MSIDGRRTPPLAKFDLMDSLNQMGEYECSSAEPVRLYEESRIEISQTSNGAHQEVSVVGPVSNHQTESGESAAVDSRLVSTSLTHVMQSVILPTRVMFSAIKAPFKIALKGRRRPTWSTEMEVVMSAFRSACRHAPRDLNLLRIMTDLEVPGMLLPKGAMIHQTRLQGMLVEWVFPHTLTMTESMSQSIFTNSSVLEWSITHPIVLYLHGGGYALCSSQTHRNILTAFAIHDVVLCVPNYRRAPDVSIIEAVDDCFSAYRHLVEVIGVNPSRVAIMGDSAGGALAVLTLSRIRDDKSLRLPSCGVLLSPWCELEDEKIILESEKGNVMPEHDYLPRDVLVMISRLVRGSLSPHDARINPMDADLSGLPRILIHVGELELLFEQITRFYDKLKQDKVDVKMKIWIDGVHVPHAFTTVFDEARLAVKDAAEFIKHSTALYTTCVAHVLYQVILLAETYKYFLPRDILTSPAQSLEDFQVEKPDCLSISRIRERSETISSSSSEFLHMSFCFDATNFLLRVVQQKFAWMKHFYLYRVYYLKTHQRCDYIYW